MSPFTNAKFHPKISFIHREFVSNFRRLVNKLTIRYTLHCLNVMFWAKNYYLVKKKI